MSVCSPKTGIIHCDQIFHPLKRLAYKIYMAVQLSWQAADELAHYSLQIAVEQRACSWADRSQLIWHSTWHIVAKLTGCSWQTVTLGQGSHETSCWGTSFSPNFVRFYNFILICFDLTCGAWLKPENSVQNDDSSIWKLNVWNGYILDLLSVSVSCNQENLAWCNQLQ